MYVLDSISTSPWVGSLDDVYPVKIDSYSPLSVEPNTTFSINYTLRNTHSASSWRVWGKLYQGTGPTGTLLSQFDSGTVYIAPNGTYSAPATVIYGGIGVSTSYYIEAGHITLDEYLFTAVENPAAGGVITGTPDGSIVSGTPVSVTASAPNPGYSWGGWTANGITLSNPNALTQAFNMPANEVTLVANFPLLNTYSFSRSANPSAGGSISGTANGSYAQNFSVSVTASAPNPGYSWGGWTANGITLSNPNALTQAFNMPANTVSLTANYSYLDPTGACCIGANCSLTTQANCAGTWQGAGTSCVPNPCSAGGDCTNPSGADGTNRCINGYVYNCSNGSWEPAFPITECEIECVGTDTSCIDGYINDCNYGTWEPSGDRCFVEPAQSKMLIVAAAVLGGLTIIALLSRSRK